LHPPTRGANVRHGSEKFDPVKERCNILPAFNGLNASAIHQPNGSSPSKPFMSSIGNLPEPSIRAPSISTPLFRYKKEADSSKL
ncbi:unnamed protein product, partial [Musa textilis]